MAAPFTCARCRTYIGNANCTGTSGLYQSNHTLCEPCFFEEDAEIEERGTNNLPDRLASYGPPNGDYD